MPANFKNLFGETKPAIAMVHLGALPGSPLYEEQSGIGGIVEAARADLNALQQAGFDAIMFGNENDRPYELEVDTASTATMAYVIGELRREITVPFGVNVLWDSMASMALAAATGARFVREIFTGVYASDMGLWSPDAGRAIRYRNRLGRKDLAVLYNVSAEFAASLDSRSVADRARSAVFSSVPDAVLVSGQITGEACRIPRCWPIPASGTIPWRILSPLRTAASSARRSRSMATPGMRSTRNGPPGSWRWSGKRAEIDGVAFG